MSTTDDLRAALQHESAQRERRRTRKSDYRNTASPNDFPIYNWHKRTNKFQKRCALCGNNVPPGNAWMRKNGTRWEVAHSYHQDIAST